MRRSIATLLTAACAWLASSCAPSGFTSESQVQSVRILASGSVDLTTADPASNPSPAYAQPGDQVGLQVVAYDGRTDQPEPMTISWLQIACVDPPGDAYYACFEELAQAEEAGAPAGADGGAGALLGALRPGVDITPLLHNGPSIQFQMPPDVITQHTPVPGSVAPYGLAILFNFACAGHLELLPSSGNPQQVPVGCFDMNENQLGPDDYVIGFTRVYAFGPGSAAGGGVLMNANPVIGSLDVNGQSQPVTLASGATQAYTAAGIQATHCGPGSSCDVVKIGPIVPASSWEVDPATTDVHGNPLHEEIWLDAYTTFGSLSGSTGLLYDATAGSLGGPSKTDAELTPPSDAGQGFIWIVVHDSRGGAAWVTVPVQVQ